MKVIALAFAGLLALVAPALAADVDGKWTGMVDTPMGPASVAFEFKADGATLTGTATGIDGSVVPIKNGKIDGNNVTYIVVFDFGGMPLQFDYKGVLSGTEIKMSAEFMGMQFQFTVKKS